jgi:hypothetical protein
LLHQIEAQDERTAFNVILQTSTGNSRTDSGKRIPIPNPPPQQLKLSANHYAPSEEKYYTDHIQLTSCISKETIRWQSSENQLKAVFPVSSVKKLLYYPARLSPSFSEVTMGSWVATSQSSAFFHCS